MTLTLAPESCDETPVEQPKLTGVRLKNYRKSKLMRRDGKRCFYCYRPFTCRLVGATIDHVVPRSLFRTNALAHVVLACGPCNNRKADRLPLTVALILCAHVDRSRPTDHIVSARAHDALTVFTGPLTTAGWLMLARIAAAREVAARSTPDLRDEARHTPRHTVGVGEVHPPVNARESAVNSDRSGALIRLDSQPLPVFVSTRLSAGEVAA